MCFLHCCITKIRELTNDRDVISAGVADSKRLPKWLSGKRTHLKCRRCRFDPWVGKIPQRRNGKPLQYSAWEIPCTEDAGGPQSMGLQMSWMGLNNSSELTPNSVLSISA